MQWRCDFAHGQVNLQVELTEQGQQLSAVSRTLLLAEAPSLPGEPGLGCWRLAVVESGEGDPA